MSDMNELLKAIKEASVEAVEAEKPVDLCFGSVTSVSPLQINVEQKMTLGAKQLILSRQVTDYVTTVTVDWMTNSAAGLHTHTYSGSTNDGDSYRGTTDESGAEHEHAITGTKEVIIHNGLSVGDEVILIRQQEGQKYIVLDKVGV